MSPAESRSLSDKMLAAALKAIRDHEQELPEMTPQQVGAVWKFLVQRFEFDIPPPIAEFVGQMLLKYTLTLVAKNQLQNENRVLLENVKELSTTLLNSYDRSATPQAARGTQMLAERDVESWFVAAFPEEDINIVVDEEFAELVKVLAPTQGQPPVSTTR